MAETPPPNDDANDYLLGRLAPAARRKFAARLERDAELRRLVRDLEEGLLALALTAPRREPPRELWPRIEAAAFKPARRHFWFPFLSITRPANVWAMAGGLAAALLLLAFWIHSAASPAKSAPPGGGTARLSFAAPAQRNSTTTPHPAGPRENLPPNKNHSPAAAQTTPGPLPGNTAAVSPDTAGKRFLPAPTMARGRSRPAAEQSRGVLPAMTRPMGGTNHLLAPDLGRPVEVVDLSDPTVAELAPGLTTTGYFGFDPASGVEPSDAGIIGMGFGGIPLQTGDNQIFVIIDPGLLPAGARQVTVWSVAGDGQVALVGTVTLGGNPTLINITNADISGWRHYYATIDGTNVMVPFP